MIVLILAVIAGRWVASSPVAGWFLFDHHQLTVLLCVYGFVASVLPVWLLLAPRDYLSSYMKIGTIALLVVGVLVVHPDLKLPAFTQFVHGGGPIVPGKVFPFVFITIACGAISGFHALVASGTTPKMLDRETRRPLHRLRRDADGGPRRGRGADRRVLAAPGRLLRDQRLARGVRTRSGCSR